MGIYNCTLRYGYSLRAHLPLNPLLSPEIILSVLQKNEAIVVEFQTRFKMRCFSHIQMSRVLTATVKKFGTEVPLPSAYLGICQELINHFWNE